MAEQKGKLITCDRCGNTVFCRATNEKEIDGGFTRWNEFEKADGWGREDGKDLCRSCNDAFAIMKQNFSREKRAFFKNQ